KPPQMEAKVDAPPRKRGSFRRQLPDRWSRIARFVLGAKVVFAVPPPRHRRAISLGMTAVGHPGATTIRRLLFDSAEPSEPRARQDDSLRRQFEAWSWRRPRCARCSRPPN